MTSCYLTGAVDPTVVSELNARIAAVEVEIATVSANVRWNCPRFMIVQCCVSEQAEVTELRAQFVLQQTQIASLLEAVGTLQAQLANVDPSCLNNQTLQGADFQLQGSSSVSNLRLLFADFSQGAGAERAVSHLHRASSERIEQHAESRDSYVRACSLSLFDRFTCSTLCGAALVGGWFVRWRRARRVKVADARLARSDLSSIGLASTPIPPAARQPLPTELEAASFAVVRIHQSPADA